MRDEIQVSGIVTDGEFTMGDDTYHRGTLALTIATDNGETAIIKVKVPRDIAAIIAMSIDILQ